MRCFPNLFAVLALVCLNVFASAEEPRLELVLKLRRTSPVNGVALRGDGKHVVTGVGDTPILWEAASGKKLKTFRTPPEAPDSISSFTLSVVLSGDGKHILSGSYGGEAILWEVAIGKQLKRYEHDDT